MRSMAVASSSVRPRARWIISSPGMVFAPVLANQIAAIHSCEMPAKSTRAKTQMSDEHKEALARGRDEGRAVRRYLEAIEAHRPKRGRKRTPDSIRKRLQGIEERLESADPLSRVQLIQERVDLQAELAGGETHGD